MSDDPDRGRSRLLQERRHPALRAAEPRRRLRRGSFASWVRRACSRALRTLRATLLPRSQNSSRRKKAMRRAYSRRMAFLFDSLCAASLFVAAILSWGMAATVQSRCAPQSAVCRHAVGGVFGRASVAEFRTCALDVAVPDAEPGWSRDDRWRCRSRAACRSGFPAWL